MLMTNGVGAVLGNIVAGLVIVKWFEDPVTHVKDWHGIWITFAVYALVVAVLFAVLFKHKHNPDEVMNVHH
jgi:sugar phosphate permease